MAVQHGTNREPAEVRLTLRMYNIPEVLQGIRNWRLARGGSSAARYRVNVAAFPDEEGIPNVRRLEYKYDTIIKLSDMIYTPAGVQTLERSALRRDIYVKDTAVCTDEDEAVGRDEIGDK